jgi:diaminohydroxyphosphoribosylaminopyrimidine deaminase/5-amino-6-(5-phosphoribosylamino)uracil reductase
VPNRVVLDAKLKIQVSSKLVQSARLTPTWVFTAENTEKSKIDVLEGLGVHVVTLPATAEGQLSLADFLSFAADHGWARIMVEGGAKLLSSFLIANLVDELAVFQSSAIALDDQGRQLGGLESFKASDFLQNFQFQNISLVGKDAVLRLMLK